MQQEHGSAVRVGGRRDGVPAPQTLAGCLTRLQLTAIRDQLDKLHHDAAAKKLTLRESLAMLLEREVTCKDERRIEMAIKIAHFPMVREFADFDFKAELSVDRRQVRELATSRWVAHGHALLLLGPPGLGNSHLAIALGRAIRQSYSVPFTTAQALMAALVKTHSEGRLEDRLAPSHLREAEAAHPRRAWLPAVQGAGRAPVLPARLAALQRGRILITSNRSVAECGEVFGDAVVATAIQDRLLHRRRVGALKIPAPKPPTQNNPVRRRRHEYCGGRRVDAATGVEHPRALQLVAASGQHFPPCPQCAPRRP